MRGIDKVFDLLDELFDEVEDEDVLAKLEDIHLILCAREVL